MIFIIFTIVLVALAIPMGSYIAHVLEADGAILHMNWLSKIEDRFFALIGIDAKQDMDWRQYCMSMLVFSFIGLAFVYLIQRLQGLTLMPANPQHFVSVTPALATNTAVSFVTNTNWQAYGGETTMSYLTQMLALASQNFLSAATGIAILAALTRAFKKQPSGLGNFWRDLCRSTLLILMPLSIAFALLLVSQGCPQTLSSSQAYTPYLSTRQADASGVQTQQIAMGPIASQIAIKQLGTNGGGYFNTNSAHPYENPTPLSNFLETLAILLIPAALCQTFGVMTGAKKQGWALLAVMLILFGAALCAAIYGENALPLAGSNMVNMEGKEVRIGEDASILWAVATTAASNGSVNAMHDSLSPLGGLVPMFLMQLGEVVFGGVGSGLYGLIVFALITVFISGLMVGRTPEFLSKKIEAFEIKMCSLVILVPPIAVLIGTAIAVSCEAGRSAVLNTGPHAFSEILYAFSSAGNNNGSAFAGLSANSVFYNVLLAIAMWISRFWLAVPVLALAGSISRKRSVPVGAGTMPTDNALFVMLLIGVVIVFGGLTFVPALALGPIVEHLMEIKP
ncbi:MAG: potassium-transporting ATPase subunit KdpA [Candidatus Obscuribacterales bacterium]|nr:potassium-transporting ATPase subunit KdpA [Candidatus Obscuribacterales bacterium]